MEEDDKGCPMIRMGECFFWYRPTRVVPDKRQLNGCVCVSQPKNKLTSLFAAFNTLDFFNLLEIV